MNMEKEAPGVNLTGSRGLWTVNKEAGVTMSRIFSILERTFSLHCNELMVSLKFAAMLGPEELFFSMVP